MSDCVSTSIRISTKKLPSDERAVLPTELSSTVYVVQHKRYSRSLENIFHVEDDALEVGDIISEDVVNATLDDNKCKEFTTSVLNPAVNNTITFESDLIDYKSFTTSNVNYIFNDKQALKARNKSISEVENVNQMIGMLENTSCVSASVDNIYENGKFFAKLVESDSETISSSVNELNRLVQVQYKPKKPKRSMKFDRDRCTFIQGSSVNDIAHAPMPGNVYDENDLIISKEEFDAFVEREKSKFSGIVSDDFFVLPGNDSFITSNPLEDLLFLGSSAALSTTVPNNDDDGEVEDNYVSLVQYVDPGDIYHTPPRASSHVIETAPRVSMGSERIKVLGDVLDTQMVQLERLLSSTNSPSSSTETLLDDNMIGDTNLEGEKFRGRVNLYESPNNNMDTLKTTLEHKHNFSHGCDDEVDSPVVRRMIYIQPERRTKLPDIPEDEATSQHTKRFNRFESFRKSMRHVHKSLKRSRKRIITKSGRTVTITLINKSFRIPKSPKRLRRSKSGSRNERIRVKRREKYDTRSSNESLSSSSDWDYLPSNQSRKKSNPDNRTLKSCNPDGRTSKMIGIEYERMRLALKFERQQVWLD